MNQTKNISYTDYIGSNTIFSEELSVVDYNRVSTKKEAQYFSLEDQIEANKNFISRYKSWKHVNSYVEMKSGTIRVFEYLFEDLRESAKLAYKLMIESYCEQGALLVERESDSVKKELEGVVSNIKAMEADLKSHKIDYVIFKDLYAELKNDEANLRYQYNQLRMQEKREMPNKVDIFNKLEKALDKTLSIDEETLEVDEELLNAFLLKLVTKVTDDCFELTYFLDLTGEAYLKEDINLNCFDKNYSASYKLPEDYTVFDSFIITKEEADVYASKLNKRSFKSHIWNDIKVNIVLEYSI